MPFTVQELNNIANAAMDYHLDKGKVHSQTIQEKPLLRRMKAAQKTFPGGKGNIDVRVKGVYTTGIQGFTHDDTVTYTNPANIKQASFPWKEVHAGIQITMTELKKAGISVTDTNGANTSEHSQAELIQLANLLDDKLEDMSEGSSRGQNLMYWRDGTQDAKLAAGIKSFIVDNPAAAVTVGGLDQQANDWWRNRASLGIIANESNAANQGLIKLLSKERRQLRRYGGRPDVGFCGSDFLDQIENELRANGSYTNVGWAKGGKVDLSVADQTLKDISLEYDPTLDDEGESKRCYILDFSTIYPMVMQGEDWKRHTPSRPEDKYVIYRAMTWTGGLVCRQRNANGVYSIA